MFDHLPDLDTLLRYAEELLDILSTDGRYVMYVRDLSRLVSWLRSQSRGRVLLVGAVAAAVLAVVLISSWNVDATRPSADFDDLVDY